MKLTEKPKNSGIFHVAKSGWAPSQKNYQPKSCLVLRRNYAARSAKGAVILLIVDVIALFNIHE